MLHVPHQNQAGVRRRTLRNEGRKRTTGQRMRGGTVFLLKLQSGHLGWKAGDDTNHLPRPKGFGGSSDGAALGHPIVLGKTALRIRR